MRSPVLWGAVCAGALGCGSETSTAAVAADVAESPDAAVSDAQAPDDAPDDATDDNGPVADTQSPDAVADDAASEGSDASQDADASGLDATDGADLAGPAQACATRCAAVTQACSVADADCAHECLTLTEGALRCLEDAQCDPAASALCVDGPGGACEGQPVGCFADASQAALCTDVLRPVQLDCCNAQPDAANDCLALEGGGGWCCGTAPAGQ